MQKIKKFRLIFKLSEVLMDLKKFINYSKDLLKPKYLFPPLFGVINEQIKLKKIGISYPFHNCGFNRDIETIFDIGANVGDVTLSAARSFPNAQIHSFEPVSSTYKLLYQNVKNFDRILPHNFGFYNSSKLMDMNITTFNGANSLIKQSNEHKLLNPHVKEVNTERIRLFTLDSFVSKYKIDHIDIMKIDVEGVEKEVIEGGMNTLKTKVDNVFIELSFIRKGQNSSNWFEICKLLHELGFFLVNIYDIEKYVENDREYLNQIDVFFSKIK